MAFALAADESLTYSPSETAMMHADPLGRPGHSELSGFDATGVKTTGAGRHDADFEKLVPDSIAAGDLVRTGFGDRRPAVYSSAELFGGDREVWIEHRGELYRLRITGSGKLYLTK